MASQVIIFSPHIWLERLRSHRQSYLEQMANAHGLDADYDNDLVTDTLDDFAWLLNNDYNYYCCGLNEAAAFTVHCTMHVVKRLIEAPDYAGRERNDPLVRLYFELGINNKLFSKGITWGGNHFNPWIEYWEDSDSSSCTKITLLDDGGIELDYLLCTDESFRTFLVGLNMFYDELMAKILICYPSQEQHIVYPELYPEKFAHET